MFTIRMLGQTDRSNGHEGSKERYTFNDKSLFIESLLGQRKKPHSPLPSTSGQEEETQLSPPTYLKADQREKPNCPLLPT